MEVLTKLKKTADHQLTFLKNRNRNQNRNQNRSPENCLYQSGSTENGNFIHKYERRPSMVLVSLVIWIFQALPGAGVAAGAGVGAGASSFPIIPSSSSLPRIPATLHVLPPASPSIEPFKINTTSFAGQTAYLHCVVTHLGDKTVSWIRRRDLHILTSGNHVYTSDPRVSLLRQGKLYNSWTLKMVNVQKKDEGAYECQVNTEPKLTATLNLVIFGSLSEDSKFKAAGWRVNPIHPSDLTSSPLQLDSNFLPKPKVSESRILGPPRLDLVEGSIGNLTCIISHPGLSPPNVTWYHDDVPVKHSSIIRGGMSIETEKSLFRTISKLVIIRVDWRDAGKYSCGGSTVYPASVLIHVTSQNFNSGERRAGREGDVDKSKSGLSVNDPRPMVSIGNSLHQQQSQHTFTHFHSSQNKDKTRTRRTENFLLYNTIIHPLIIFSSNTFLILLSPLSLSLSLCLFTFFFPSFNFYNFIFCIFIISISFVIAYIVFISMISYYLFSFTILCTSSFALCFLFRNIYDISVTDSVFTAASCATPFPKIILCLNPRMLHYSSEPN